MAAALSEPTRHQDHRFAFQDFRGGRGCLQSYAERTNERLGLTGSDPQPHHGPRVLLQRSPSTACFWNVVDATLEWDQSYPSWAGSNHGQDRARFRRRGVGDDRSRDLIPDDLVTVIKARAR